ncbi:DUF5615 family PIN-like protein [Parathermosynechococcus lividus]
MTTTCLPIWSIDNELLTPQGFPPKVIWIRRGNCSATTIETMLSAHLTDIEALNDDPTLGILTLY